MIFDTSLPAIGSTSQYGHRWDTHIVIIDLFWPGFGWNYAHRLPDCIVSTSKFISELRESCGVYVEIVL